MNSGVQPWKQNHNDVYTVASIKRPAALPSEHPIGVKSNWIIDGRSIARTIAARRYYRINAD